MFERENVRSFALNLRCKAQNYDEMIEKQEPQTAIPHPKVWCNPYDEDANCIAELQPVNDAQNQPQHRHKEPYQEA